MTYKVRVEPSGRTFSVAQGETILQAGMDADVPLPYGCRDGACGSCKCQKLSGEVEMDGHYAESALNSEEKEQGLILTCRAKALSDVVLEAKQVGLINMFDVRKLPTRVSSLERLSHDVMLVKLQLPANQNFQYFAGQYVDLILRDGTRRSYSMASAPQEGQSSLELHIRHMAGGKFTEHLFQHCQERDVLRLEGPMGSFFLRNEAQDADKPMIFLASGTGFAPLKAILEQMQTLGVTRPISLYWGGRRPQDLYFHQWVVDILESMPNVSYVPVLSEATAEDQWTGRSGLVHQAVLDDVADLSTYQVYACGVPVMVEFAQRDFTQMRGLPAEQFFSDAFITEKEKNTNA